MPDLTLFYAMTVVAMLIIGLAKGGLGGTLGSLSVPLMALVMPADKVIGLILPLLMIADVFALASHWRRWEVKLVLLLLPAAVVGITIGVFFVSRVSSETLRTALGIIVLLFVAYKVFEQRIFGAITYEPRNWHGIAAGSVAGFTSGVAHTGGPPITIYLLMQDLQPRVFVSTSVLFFTVVNWIKVPYYYYAGFFDFPLLAQVVWLIPVLPLGVLVGRWGVDKVDKELFNRIIIVVLAISAVLLLR